MSWSMLIVCFIRHGAQGTFDSASKATLDNEFGTHIDDEVIKQILEKGALQESEVCIPIFILLSANYIPS
jgi:hypothetical protein